MNDLDRLLNAIAKAGIKKGARHLRSVARDNPAIKTGLEILAGLASAQVQAQTRRRRSLNPPMIDRQSASPASPPPPSADPLRALIEDAAAFVAEHSGTPAAEILTDRAARDRAYRTAALNLHPDRQHENEAAMQKLTAHWRVLRVLNEVQP